MATQKQKIKGRALTYIDKHHEPKGIEYPKYGAISFDVMEVKAYFDIFKDHLQLPEKYTIIGVYFDVYRYQWCIIVESNDIPLPKPNEATPMPMLLPLYEDTVDGKVCIVDLKLI